MRLQQRFWDLLARGEGVVPDPDARVQLGLVQLVEGPMKIERLRAEGIEATGLESFDLVTQTNSQMRIMVRQDDLAAARAVLDVDS